MHFNVKQKNNISDFINSRLLAASKTANNFTGGALIDLETWKPVEEPIEEETTITVSLDWLQVMAYCWIGEPDQDVLTYKITDEIGLRYLKRGTPIFKHSYEVVLWGEPVAYLHTHCRDGKITGAGVVKLEIQNHVLYADWYDTYNTIMQALDAKLKNISRFDISIDGCNWIPLFLNAYMKQLPGDKTIELKGKVEPGTGKLHKKTMLFRHFKFGMGECPKQLRVYEKVQELEKSNKVYIREMWERAGIHSSEVWRCELRMKSEAIKTVKHLKIDKLTDPKYLLSVFRTQVKNFFEFVEVTTDTNISRAKAIDLLCFDQLFIPTLQKVKRALVDGRYKAKLAIHNAVKDLLNGRIEKETDVDAALQHISSNMSIYNLARYFMNKVDEWIEKYQSGTLDNETAKQRQQLLYQMINN